MRAAPSAPVAVQGVQSAPGPAPGQAAQAVPGQAVGSRHQAVAKVKDPPGTKRHFTWGCYKSYVGIKISQIKNNVFTFNVSISKSRHL